VSECQCRSQPPYYISCVQSALKLIYSNAEFQKFSSLFYIPYRVVCQFHMSQPAERALSQLKLVKESNKEPVLQMTHSQHASANCVILRKGSEKQTLLGKKPGLLTC